MSRKDTVVERSNLTVIQRKRMEKKDAFWECILFDLPLATVQSS